jgi:hypothetical protein
MHASQISEYFTTALQQIHREEFSEALEWLNKCEIALEKSARKRKDCDLVLVILHNKALCYHRNRMLKEACIYIDACCYNTETKTIFSGSTGKGAARKVCEEVRRLRYLARLRLIQAWIYSNMAKNRLAYEQTLLSIKAGELAISHCYSFCKQKVSLFKQGRFNTHSDTSKLTSYCIATLPFLQGLFLYLRKRVSRFPHGLEERNFLDDETVVLHTPDQILSVPELTLKEAKRSYSMIDEMSQNSLRESISVLSLSFHLAAKQLESLKKSGDKEVPSKDIRRFYQDGYVISRDFLDESSAIHEYISTHTLLLKRKRSAPNIKRSASLKPIRPNFRTDLVQSIKLKSSKKLKSTNRSRSVIRMNRHQIIPNPEEALPSTIPDLRYTYTGWI